MISSSYHWPDVIYESTHSANRTTRTNDYLISATMNTYKLLTRQIRFLLIGIFSPHEQVFIIVICLHVLFFIFHRLEQNFLTIILYASLHGGIQMQIGKARNVLQKETVIINRGSRQLVCNDIFCSSTD